MGDTAAISNPVSDAAASTKAVEKAQWPLSYRLQLSKTAKSSLQTYGFGTGKPPPRIWWSHELYRGPDDKEVEILYSRDKAQSELIAQHFTNEPILGFDMEWPWKDSNKAGLQNKVGLIQIASESKIGLFHIGLHPGKTTEDIIAPTLKRLIESPKIGKAGVHILQADFGRLSRFFGLQPQRAIELSNLFRLVKFGPHKPELVSVKLVSLAHQVEDQLGLPLYKGSVRTSDWSRPLSKEQISYAATDSYAGFMLYHCMNAKRLAMKPTPPHPIYAERYPKGPASRDDPILLDTGGDTTTTSELFFGVKPVKSGSSVARTVAKRKVTVATATPSGEPLDPLTQSVLDELKARRAALAKNSKLPPYRIISDRILENIARERPSNMESLLNVKGIGKFQQEKYGDDWLEVISSFLAKNGLGPPLEDAVPAPSESSKGAIVSTPQRTRTQRQVSRDSSPAFDTPPPQTPQLQTGLSFTMASTTLGTDADGDATLFDSDGSLPDLDFGSVPRQMSSELKRKRIESPRKHRTSPTIGCRQDVTPHLQQPDIGPIPTTNPPVLALPAAQPTPSKIITAEELSPRSKIARNKLRALSKLVTRKLPDRPADARPIVTERTLTLIIQSSPRTQDELEQIPGIDGFLLACEKTGTDLLRNVIKFALSRNSGTSYNQSM